MSATMARTRTDDGRSTLPSLGTPNVIPLALLHGCCGFPTWPRSAREGWKDQKDRSHSCCRKGSNKYEGGYLHQSRLRIGLMPWRAGTNRDSRPNVNELA